ncbi:MAG TPA: nucleotidyltransferase family protein [Longimicrobium sp.]|nr:nucleotidyltransferase family protein [Longimicrobium sp.]
MPVRREVPAKLPIAWDRIEAFCRRWGIAEFALFGSVLRDDFRPDSDVDVLVSYAPDASPSLLDHAEKEEELAEIFGRPVDLISRQAVEHSRNPYRRRSILESARVIYESA